LAYAGIAKRQARGSRTARQYPRIATACLTDRHFERYEIMQRMALVRYCVFGGGISSAGLGHRYEARCILKERISIIWSERRHEVSSLGVEAVLLSHRVRRHVSGVDEAETDEAFLH
jgi:hypothetical protein